MLSSHGLARLLEAGRISHARAIPGPPAPGHLSGLVPPPRDPKRPCGGLATLPVVPRVPSAGTWPATSALWEGRGWTSAGARMHAGCFKGAGGRPVDMALTGARCPVATEGQVTTAG